MKRLFILTIILITFTYSILTSASVRVLNNSVTSSPITFSDGTFVEIPTHYTPPKQELRGVWITTVYNLDIKPQLSSSPASIEAYKLDFIKILDTLESYHMNALFFQVRPTNDAFYKSSLNPWSKYLIGVEGMEPNWDPLLWMIEETHKRNIQFHAWFNPYRVTQSTSLTKDDYINQLSNKNFAFMNSEKVLEITLENNKRQLILNPGEPLVQEFIIDTVMEVVENYPIDGVHFDDYFYPYEGLLSQDNDSFIVNNPNQLNLADWRRENVNIVIKTIKEKIKEYNDINRSAVQFGVSPFGIWANKSSHPLGSQTNGNQSYYTQFADSRKWVKEGWVDYIIPQVYWDFEQNSAPYADVVLWWMDVVRNTNVNLYIGHALYRYGEGNGWLDPMQIPNQILFNQNYDLIEGSVFYRYRFLIDKDNEILTAGVSTIETFYSQNEVLPPSIKNISQVAPNQVNDLTLTYHELGVDLEWMGEDGNTYAIYRFEEGESIDITENDHLLKITDTPYYTDHILNHSIKYTYVVTSFNNVFNESEPASVFFQPLDYFPKLLNTKDMKINVNDMIDFKSDIKSVDYFGNDLTNQIQVDINQLNIDKIGTYPIVYSVIDDKNRVTSSTIWVEVVDTTPPKLTVNQIILDINQENIDYLKEIQIIDNYDQELSGNLIIDDSEVNINKVGVYPLIISIHDQSNNFTNKIVMVNVVDRVAPVIYNAKDLVIKIGSQNIDWLGDIKAIDNYDGDITLSVVVDIQNVDLNRKGTYPLLISVSDYSGNQLQEVVNVIVVENKTISEQFIIGTSIGFILLFYLKLKRNDN